MLDADPKRRPTNNSQKDLRPVRLRRRWNRRFSSVSDDEISDGDRWRRRRHSGAVFGRTLPARLTTTTIRPCVYSDGTPLGGGGGGGCVERTFVAVARVFSSGGSSRRLLFLFSSAIYSILFSFLHTFWRVKKNTPNKI